MQTSSRQRWTELAALLEQTRKHGTPGLTVVEVKRLCRLYRHVTIDLSRARASAGDPELVRFLNSLAARAHGQIYTVRRTRVGNVFQFFTATFPALVRARAVPIFLASMVFLLSGLGSFVSVVRDPETAYSLFNEDVIEYENLRLERQEGSYKGNFTFDVSRSPLVAAMIIGNNIKVAMLEFAFGALGCLPGLLLLIYNGQMLGTLSGVVWNHGYLLDFYSLIATHGVLELSAICIAGGAGLLVGWSLIAPGRRTRRAALARAAGEAFQLFAGSAAVLIVAGIIEAYVTPHFSAPVRWSVAGTTAVSLAAYLGLAGRNARSSGVDQSKPRPVISK